MNIIGIGTDIVECLRIARMIERHDELFLNRVYTRHEIQYSSSRKAATQHYAGRWAAKEACSKALGTGLRMGIAWRDMSVTNLSSGQPVMEIRGWAKNRLDEMTPSDHEAVVHVSLTDDHPWAQAYVVIEARPLA